MNYRTISHYRIEKKLGEGGMGMVYLAFDERLHRQVALKILHGAATAHEDARRQLRHEAAALLRLSHPRIGTLLDFDSADGVDFIVMELVTGSTLEERLTRGRLPVSEALGYAEQIAEALEEAHEHRVIHRDLKPANIMVTPKGQVKVMDFGLAKLLHGPSELSDTRSRSETASAEHLVKGTYPYMAPEQLLAGQVDERTDIHAFGVVLYEMLTGERPYRGRTTHSLVNAIVNDMPVPLARVVRGLPPRIERFVLRCLEKDPARRFATIAELLGELRGLSSRPGFPNLRWPVPAGWSIAAALVLAVAGLLIADAGGVRTQLIGNWRARQIRSVAVLPLTNLSDDPQREFLAAGLTDALIAQLTQAGSFDVISRTSMLRYKATRLPLQQIGRELQVDALIEGSIMPVGDRVRITVELVRASDDRQLWAESYERQLDDVIALQSEVAQTIAEAVRHRIAPLEATAASVTGAAAKGAAGDAPDTEAQDAYLKGCYYAGKPSEAMLRISLKFFQEAVDRAPRYAAAFAGLARSRVLLASAGSTDAAELFRDAETAARRAQELDPKLPDAHLALGLARFYGGWDWAGARREIELAIALQPGSAQAHHWFSVVLSTQGLHERAVAEARRAEALDPMSLAMHLNVGMRLYYARRIPDAVAQLRQTLELEPGSSSAHYWLGLALQQAGNGKEAVEQLRLVEGPEAIGPLGYAYASMGNKPEANRMLADLTGLANSGHAWVSPLDLATICAGLGRRDEAFEWLNRACQERVPPLTALKVDPLFDSVRGDLRFAALLRRVGVPS